MTLKDYIIKLAEEQVETETEITKKEDFISYLKTFLPDIADRLVGGNAEACWTLYLAECTRLYSEGK